MLAVLSEVAPQLRFSRFGLRYVNRISVGTDGSPLGDFFELYPRLPPSLGVHGAYLVQLEVPRPPHVVIATLGSAPAQALASTHLLDIYDHWEPAEPVDVGTAQDALDAAHEHVEEVFQSTITDRLRLSLSSLKVDRW